MKLEENAVDKADLVIHGFLNLAEAQSLAERLLARRGADLLIDASGVDHLGSPCAQVLMSAVGTWRDDGHTIGLSSASEGFRQGVRLLGLSHALISEV